MNQDMLVFAAKEVGLELVVYLLEIDAPVQHVIVGTAADQELLGVAAAHGISAEVYTHETQSQLIAAGQRYEWLLNLWCPHILRPAVLALAEHRLNVHPSLVPHCRGNDNAAWIIRKGLPAGVSLIEMREVTDAGEVYVQEEVPYSLPIRGRELHERLQREVLALFKTHWQAIYAGEIVPKPQVGPVSQHTRRQTEADRVSEVSTRLSMEDFMRWILAHDFSPGTTAEVNYLGRTYKLKLSVEEKTG